MININVSLNKQNFIHRLVLGIYLLILEVTGLSTSDKVFSLVGKYSQHVKVITLDQ